MAIEGPACLLRGIYMSSSSFVFLLFWGTFVTDIFWSRYPRLDYHAANGCGLVYLPDMVRNAFIDETSEATPDGRNHTNNLQLLGHADNRAMLTGWL